MELSALHAAVRAVVRGAEPEAATLRPMSAAERSAFATLRRRIGSVEGKIGNILPAAAPLMWVAESRRELAG